MLSAVLFECFFKSSVNQAERQAIGLSTKEGLFMFSILLFFFVIGNNGTCILVTKKVR